MALKRQLREDGGGEFQLLNKRRHLRSTIFKGMSGFRNPEELVAMLEPMIRKCVKEEVGRAVGPYLRSLDTQFETSRSWNLHLQFETGVHRILFTNNKIVSEAKTPVKIALYDPTTLEIVSSGPCSSMKVGIFVVEGGFDMDESSQKEFERKVVQNREGKRPLLNGEMIVTLKNGVGYIDNLSFTDNSSWDRSGMFRLGVKKHSGFDEMSVREGVSNAFKVKDHRGESYQKHHPPSLNSEVWRLDKIAKDGAYHRQLSKLRVHSVGDFLRSHARDQISLRNGLRNISDRKWDIIVSHAEKCILDEKRSMYTTAQGTVLVFDSVYNVIGVAFDGLTYQPVDSLDVHQSKRVQNLKQIAFENISSWEICEEDHNLNPQNGNLHLAQGEVEMMEMNAHHPAALDQKIEAEDVNSSFEYGESSQMQGFNLTFNSSFVMVDSPAEFYMEARDFTTEDDDFEVELSALREGRSTSGNGGGASFSWATENGKMRKCDHYLCSI